VGRAPPSQKPGAAPSCPAAIKPQSADRIVEKRLTSGADFRLVIRRQKFSSWRHFDYDDESAIQNRTFVGDHRSVIGVLSSS